MSSLGVQWLVAAFHGSCLNVSGQIIAAHDRHIDDGFSEAIQEVVISSGVSLSAVWQKFRSHVDADISTNDHDFNTQKTPKTWN